MEPKQQAEIQLGHMCNNRCVFCVSGQRTEMHMARPLPVEPMLQRIEEAYAAGNRKITLLGGEPTLQPGFMDVVRRCVELGFEEIVIFTNAVKTSREWFLDQVIETGGNFTWRISIQGADLEHHEDTTKRVGSFDRIVQTMDSLNARGERVTVNMCVVTSNYASVAKFPELLLPRNVQQLHLDMIRPRDAGERTEDELRGMLPRYSDMVPHLEAMIAGFPDGFDVNIGNLPFCVAPRLAPFIHHDGEKTFTISVEGDAELSEAWDKYEDKRTDKLKIASCRECVFDSRCSGIFETYRDFYGTSELVPVTAEGLREADPELRVLAVHLEALVRRLSGFDPPAPFELMVAETTGDREVTLTLTGPDGPLSVALVPPGRGIASFDLFGLEVRAVPRGARGVREALGALWNRFVELGLDVLHPLGDDALGEVTRSIGARLFRLREAAPFPGLSWDGVRVSEGGRRAECTLTGPEGQRVTFFLGEERGRPTGGYRVDEGTPSEALVAGLRAVMAALSRTSPAPAAAPDPPQSP